MDAAIRAYVEGTFQEIPPSILEDVSSGKFSLLLLVRTLGASLTSEDDAERTLAVSLLSGVVVYLLRQNTQHLHPQMSKQVINTLTSFFCDKFADATALADEMSRKAHKDPLVPASAPRAVMREAEMRAMQHSKMLFECLEALLALSAAGFEGDRAVGRHHFGGEEARLVSGALFAAIQMRNYPQSLRFVVCKLLDSLVGRNRAGLLAMRAPSDSGETMVDGKAFIMGYTSLVAGEKDPRNLLVLFGIEKVLLLEWTMDYGEIEALYNVIFCYFPITFRPPPDDPYRISPDDLKLALRACISATPQFAPLAIPILLEKLSASGGSAKVDTLQTLDAALPVYGRAAAEVNGDELWGFIKLDILQATDDESAACAQQTLTMLLRVLYADMDQPTGLAMHILDDCLGEFRTPAKALAKTCMKVVQSMLEATRTTSNAAISAILTLLLEMLQKTTDAGEEHCALELVAMLLDILQRVYAATPLDGAPTRTYESDKRPLQPFHAQLFSVLTKGVERRKAVPALHGLVMLAQIPGFFAPDELGFTTRAIQTVYLSPNVDDALREQALNGLERILLLHKRDMEENTLSFLVEQLPYTLEPHAPKDMLDKIRLVLGALSRLCTSPDLFDWALVRIFGILTHACAVRATVSRAVQVGYARALLATVQVCLERKAEARHADLPKYAASISERLFALALLPYKTGDDAAAYVASDTVFLEQVSDMLVFLLPFLSVDKQQALLVALDKLFSLPGAKESCANVRTCNPNSPVHERNLLGIPAAVLAALKKEVVLPGAPPLAWLSAVQAWLLERPLSDAVTSEAFQAKAAYLIVCAVVNKFVDPANGLDALLEAFWRMMLDEARPKRRRVQGVHAWVWTARALLMRGSELGTQMLVRMHEHLFTDPVLGRDAANALQVLSMYDTLLVRPNGFQVRLLYKQRLLGTLVPTLVNDYKHSTASKTTDLIAIATLLPALPDTTLQEQVRTLLPMLVHTLGIDDANARTSAANALLLSVRDIPELDEQGEGAEDALRTDLVDQLDTLVHALLANVMPGAYTPPHTRIAALHVLASFVPRIPNNTLVPYRRTVVQTLGRPHQGIDDTNRQVRLHAVDCRDLWFQLQVLE
ncbi:hypothetical protein MVES1_000880 [Malassezia vespertilionis]|uniref:MMS19 nucleotide excision repair protein n=1 Tax=Malassezia vespertilionis TaxID=2020962 RepID=A0A2N1JEH9_9BASI|nr:uncharacterized protein MVES1_000880 [Malassezia vespertilionis]PKI84952.1 hypothetical protein MVES_000828 [Malassezia vespertilionis]WFD05550.1 hypothetical protein MVES1_000880 [Malassezia vespertilionis]